MKTQTLLEQNEIFQVEADRWLERTKLPEILSKYGEFHLEGSYCYGLMMNGDVDMYVLVDNFTREMALHVFERLAGKIPGISGYKLRDYVNFDKPADRPRGYQISLYARENNVDWRFDIWFWTKEEYANIQNYPKLIYSKINEAKKMAILNFKSFRDQEKLKVPSVKIYDAVLKDEVMSIEDFRSYLRK